MIKFKVSTLIAIMALVAFNTNAGNIPITDDNEGLTLAHKAKAEYFSFSDEPQYMIVTANIDWPVAINGTTPTKLQKDLIQKSFHRSGSNIDDFIDDYLSQRPGGLRVTSIPEEYKGWESGSAKKYLQVKCNQPNERCATFSISEYSFNGYSNDPTYRIHVNYDIIKDDFVGISDVFANIQNDQLQRIVYKFLKDNVDSQSLYYYVENQKLKIVDFSFNKENVIFQFDNEIDGFTEIEVPKGYLASYMTSYGKYLLQVDENDHLPDLGYLEPVPDDKYFEEEWAKNSDQYYEQQQYETQYDNSSNNYTDYNNSNSSNQYTYYDDNQNVNNNYYYETTDYPQYDINYNKKRFSIGLQIGGEAQGIRDRYHEYDGYILSSYRGGVQFRVGDFRDIVNVVAGVNFAGYALVHSREYRSNYDLGWHIGFPVNLMLNLGKNSSTGKFFLGGGYEYAIGFDNMSDYQAWNAGLGYNSTNCILYLYYRRGFKNENFMKYDGITCKNNIFGLSISWLFNL